MHREAKDAGDREKPARNRSRQRTRGGQSASGHTEKTDQAAPVTDGAPDGDAPNPARRRRRRRRPNTAAPTAG